MARHETEDLWALAAGELAADAQARVEAHVAGCPACTRRLAEMRQARTLLQAAQPSTVEVRWAETDARLRALAATRLARPERRPRWPWALALAGASAAVLVLMLRSGEASGEAEGLTGARQASRQVEAAPVAPPTLLEGEASAWVREASAPEQELQPGAALRAGATVRTPTRGTARLRLPDESRLQLTPASEVVLSHVEAEEVRLTVVRGRIAVRASLAQRRGFVVEAAGLRARVVGTVFSVERTSQGAAVAVLEGKVHLEAEGQPSRRVAAGERVELHTGEHTWKQRPVSLQDRLAFEALGVRAEAPEPPRPAPPGPSRPRGGARAAKYRRYLREFPRSRWAQQARVVLLP